MMICCKGRGSLDGMGGEREMLPLVRIVVSPEAAKKIRRRAKGKGYACMCKTCGHWQSSHKMNRRLKRDTCRVKGCTCDNFVLVQIPLSEQADADIPIGKYDIDDREFKRLPRKRKKACRR